MWDTSRHPLVGTLFRGGPGHGMPHGCWSRPFPERAATVGPPESQPAEGKAGWAEGPRDHAEPCT